jgi:hypothetical protein
VKVRLQHKISRCWRTLAGAEAFLALRSYVSTARKQGMNPLPCCASLLRATPGYQPGRVLNSYPMGSFSTVGIGVHPR